MIKFKYKLFPKHFVNGIIKTIQTSENSDIAKSSLKSKFNLDDLEVKCILSFKLTYLIELVRTNNLKYFIRRLINIHRLDGCLGLSDIVNILKKNNIAYRKYEITDYDYYKQKGSKLDCATCDLVILEITNPNHNQHLEIEIDKVLDSVVDLWFGTYWFEYYECYNEQEFIDSYLNTIKEVMQNKMTFLCYHSKLNNRWYGNECYYKDEILEFDDSEDLEKRLESLRNKKISCNTIIYCFNWSKIEIYKSK